MPPGVANVYPRVTTLLVIKGRLLCVIDGRHKVKCIKGYDVCNLHYFMNCYL